MADNQNRNVMIHTDKKTHNNVVISLLCHQSNVTLNAANTEVELEAVSQQVSNNINNSSQWQHL